MSNLSPKTQRTAKDNLMDQANALVKNARIKGIKTRVRYLECFDHFAQYYADEWHGLRYYYAQNRVERLTAEGRKNVEKNVSESMGHHRTPITRVYLPEMPKKYRQKK